MRRTAHPNIDFLPWCLALLAMAFGLALVPVAALAQGPAHTIDSLKQVLAAAETDTARARITNKIGSAFFYSDMDSALYWWKRGMAIGETLALSEDSLIREKGQRTIMTSANNSAVVAHYRGLYPLALTNHQRCIRIALALKDRRGLTLSVNNIGLIKKEQGNFKDALAHFKAAHKLALQLNDSNLVGSTLNNIGTAYLKLDLDSIALIHFKRSLSYSIAIGDQVQEVDNLINIGGIFLEVGQPDSALKVLLRSDSIALAIEYEIGRPENLLGIGKALHALGRTAAAFDTLQSAIRLSRQLDLTEVTVEALENLAELQLANGLHEKANFTLRQFIQLKDSLMNSDKLLEFGQLEASFQYERAELEDQLAKDRQQQEVREQQFRQYITAFAAMVAFVFMMLLAMRWVKRRMLRKMFVFAALLFFFEFLLVVLDSFIDGLTGGLPMPKLLTNIALASLIAPAHTLLEHWLMKQKHR